MEGGNNFANYSLNSILNNPKNTTMMQSILEYISDKSGYSYDSTLTQSMVKPPDTSTTSSQLYSTQLTISKHFGDALKNSQIIYSIQSSRLEKRKEQDIEIGTLFISQYSKFHICQSTTQGHCTQSK